ncbi:MAG: hypothetical protein AAGK09_08810 [Planctomycetota bacterium]
MALPSTPVVDGKAKRDRPQGAYRAGVKLTFCQFDKDQAGRTDTAGGQAKFAGTAMKYKNLELDKPGIVFFGNEVLFSIYIALPSSPKPGKKSNFKDKAKLTLSGDPDGKLPDFRTHFPLGKANVKFSRDRRGAWLCVSKAKAIKTVTPTVDGKRQLFTDARVRTKFASN